MPKAKRVTYQDGSPAGWKIFCPGCQREHVVPESWTFNGTFESPTFRPSLDCKWPWYGESNEPQRCHSVITDGVIEFCNDCTHSLKCQRVPLPEL